MYYTCINDYVCYVWICLCYAAMLKYVCDYDIKNGFIRHCSRHILPSICLLRLLHLKINMKCHVWVESKVIQGHWWINSNNSQNAIITIFKNRNDSTWIAKIEISWIFCALIWCKFDDVYKPWENWNIPWFDPIHL